MTDIAHFVMTRAPHAEAKATQTDLAAKARRPRRWPIVVGLAAVAIAGVAATLGTTVRPACSCARPVHIEPPQPAPVLMGHSAQIKSLQP